jgi:hypothetical protein
MKDDAICSVPLQWTDLMAPDPEIVRGRRRAVFCTKDLMDLARVVSELRQQVRPKKERDV